MSGKPDPRPAKAERDTESDAIRAFRLAADECENPHCRKSSGIRLSVHHVLYGADGRHDDVRNFLALCGDGVAGCHGAAHHADPVVLAQIGEAIAARPDIIAFVLERLGADRGLDYFRRRYSLDLVPAP
jgi:hypothetical protein